MASVGNGVGQSCAFCDSHDVVWIHPLDEGLVSFREYGKGQTLPNCWALCDRCEGIYESGDDNAAVKVMRSASGWSGVANHDVAECIRQPLEIFRRADLGGRRFDAEPQRLVEALGQGFVPLRQLTGAAAELGPRWPAEHALWLDDLGPLPGEEAYDEIPDRWLVRSPWSSLSVERTLNALWRWVESDDHSNPSLAVTEDPRVFEFFTWTEAAAVAFADFDQDT